MPRSRIFRPRLSSFQQCPAFFLRAAIYACGKAPRLTVRSSRVLTFGLIHKYLINNRGIINVDYNYPPLASLLTVLSYSRRFFRADATTRNETRVGRIPLAFTTSSRRPSWDTKLSRGFKSGSFFYERDRVYVNRERRANIRGKLCDEKYDEYAILS